MYIIADIEWNMNKFGLKYPTQLAAVKVDECWNVADRFSSFIRPRDESFHNWWHVSYTGGRAEDFKNARNAYAVLADFLCWLDEDDILLWWYEESAKLFRTFVYEILKTPLANKAVVLGDYVYEHLSGQAFSRGNAYKLAEARGIDINKKLKHNSQNDVRVMHELVQKIGFPQEELQKPLVRKEQPVPKVYRRPNADLRYQYDPAENTMHILECDKYDPDRIDIVGHATLNIVFRRDVRVCDCCRTEYRKTRIERNRRRMDAMGCVYAFTEGSSVFHRKGCFSLLNATDIHGITKYQTAVGMGRVPCRLCHPTEADECRSRTAVEWNKHKEKTLSHSVPKEVKAAMKRQQIAASARARLLNDGLDEQQTKDIYTLTQPGLAFFAGRGYGTFHTSECSKLKGLTDIHGFSRYAHAMKAGLTPCRLCRPTAKQDIVLSIPITSRRRVDDSSRILEQKCTEAGYPHSYDTEYFYLETPVGKWKVNTEAFPIRLKHINIAMSPLETKYHEQPRLFLSFADVFSYIRRHDEELMRKQMEREASRQNSMLNSHKMRFAGAV